MNEAQIVICCWVFLFLLLLGIRRYIKYSFNKRSFKNYSTDLTGKYTYKKTPNGNIIKVQYEVNDKLLYRKATIHDINILKSFNFIK